MPDSPFADDNGGFDRSEFTEAQKQGLTPQPSEPTSPNESAQPDELTYHETQDVYLLPPSAPVETQRSKLRTVIGIGVASVLVAATGVGVYAYQSLASSGIQPEKVLPSTAIAFAKLDLDPAADQKIAVYRLARKFGSLKDHFTNEKDIQDSVVSAALGANPSNWNYEADVKPWLGSRIAIAAVPDVGAEYGVDPVLAISYKNRAKMVAALRKAASQGENFGYTTRNNFVLISDSQAHADQIAAQAAASSLASNSTFSGDVHTLPGNQLADAWIDLGAVTKAVKAAASKRGLPSSDAAAGVTAIPAEGRFVVGLHANADYLELTGMSRGTTEVPKAPTTGGIQKLPANTELALEFAGLGDTLTRTWNGLPAQLRSTYSDLLAAQHIIPPADFQALLGSDLTLAATNLSADAAKVAVQVTTTKGARGVEVIRSLLADFGIDPAPAGTVTQTANGYKAGFDPGYLEQVAAGKGQLGNSSVFKKAVPGAAGSTSIGFFNLGAMLDNNRDLSAKERQDAAHLSALGVSMKSTRDGATLTIRLTSR